MAGSFFDTDNKDRYPEACTKCFINPLTLLCFDQQATNCDTNICMTKMDNSHRLPGALMI